MLCRARRALSELEAGELAIVGTHIGQTSLVSSLAGIDMAAGRWDADFYLYFTSDGSSYYTLSAEQGESYFPNGFRGLQMNSVSKLPHIVNVTS